MDSVSTYSEARNEYMKQLSTWVAPYMISHYRNMWNDAMLTSQNGKVMIVFQEKCAEVPKWNQDTIDTNVNKLLDNCRCDYLEELMSAVFIAHTKVLIAIRVSSKHKKLQITLPKLDHFLHRIFSECARSFWKAPFLFLDDQKPIEMQKNLLQAEALCADAIASAVRRLLPIKNILNEYLSDDVLSSEPVIEKDEEEKVDGGSSEAPAPVAPPSTPEPPPVKEVQQVAPVETAKPQKTKPKVPKPVATLVRLTETGGEHVQEPPEDVAEPVPTPLEVSVPVVPETNSVQESEEIEIDTEQSVHFNNYDQVFDESENSTAAFKYAPKDDTVPHLDIREESVKPLSDDLDVVSLDTPGSSGLAADEILD